MNPRPSRGPRVFLTVVVAVSAIVGCGRAHPPATRMPPIVRILATDTGFVVPARIPAGITELRLVNVGTTIHEGVLTRFLTPDGRAAAYIESVKAGIDVPAFAEDSGGPGLALPGDSTAVWIELVPGHYAVTCWYGDHPENRGMTDFDVVPAASSARPPETDLTVGMYDFSYVFEGEWVAGRHLVTVENRGTEAHEFDPYRLEPGRTPADFFRWIETGRHGPAPARALGGSGTFQPGHRVWLPLTLTPGRYFAFCQMPAKNGGRAHYQLGMVREFEVR
ncbi:MAG TPA: hypothetical protein VLV15_10850 [Dongiaceae bacterium]|nr:hypothetical protein [Dongiaceae bacterium]